jgi:hypothetical protein
MLKKGVSKIASNKAVQKYAKKAVSKGANYAVDSALDYTSGEGLGKMLQKGVSSIANNNVVKKYAKKAAAKGADYALNSAIDYASGSGMIALGSGIAPAEQNYGLGGRRNALNFTQPDAKDKMAWVRAHRKSGGSMLPLGYK